MYHTSLLLIGVFFLDFMFDIKQQIEEQILHHCWLCTSFQAMNLVVAYIFWILFNLTESLTMIH